MDNALWHEWWPWVAAAVGLGILEMLVPGYIFLGFAVGAAMIGFVLAFGGTGLSVPVLLVLFALASLVAYLAMRKVFGLRTGQVKIWDRDINE